MIDTPLPKPVPGTKCTALVTPLKERQLRKCGAPATWTRGDGSPRCDRHNMGRPPRTARKSE